jgi:hypothetical protein
VSVENEFEEIFYLSNLKISILTEDTRTKERDADSGGNVF